MTPTRTEFFFTTEQRAVADQTRREADRIWHEWVDQHGVRRAGWAIGYEPNPVGPSVQQGLAAHASTCRVDIFAQIKEWDTELRQRFLLEKYR